MNAELGNTRRGFLRALSLSGLSAALPVRAGEKKARIAITFDLEMSRNFPRWEDTRWDYEKGNLNEETKRYTTDAARRVKAHGGHMHFFVVGQVFEQENVDWLKELNQSGHRIGNHTYDHINILARRPADLQYRFRRAPWLIEGKEPVQIIRENIHLCTEAMRARLGIAPAGFRTPGGSATGLNGRDDLQSMLRDLGFTWVSSKYPAHSNSKTGESPEASVIENILAAQAAAQPFVYPGGLIEIPMSPISDVGAFRNGRWKLDDFLRAIRLAVEWTIEHRAVFDFLCHPSVMYPSDPEFKTIELICDLVRKAGDRAELVTLDDIAASLSK